MSFCWPTDVHVGYTQEVEQPAVLSRFAKRCVTFGHALKAKVECTSKAVGRGASGVSSSRKRKLAEFAEKITNACTPLEGSDGDDDDVDEFYDFLTTPMSSATHRLRCSGRSVRRATEATATAPTPPLISST